jgi:hypothetical protein
MVASCVDVPIVQLSIAPGAAVRARGLADGVAIGWLTVGGAVAETDVLLVDDTWVSGASAQSAAVALKAAGARRVALVVLGRHVDPADPRSAEFLRALRWQSASMLPGRAQDINGHRPRAPGDPKSSQQPRSLD